MSDPDQSSNNQSKKSPPNQSGDSTSKPKTHIPGRTTKVLREKEKKTLAETLPTWALVLITLLGALLILFAIHQIGLLEKVP